MLRCSATRAMTRTLHEPWPKPKRPPSARDPPSQSAAPPENRRVNQPETVSDTRGGGARRTEPAGAELSHFQRLACGLGQSSSRESARLFGCRLSHFESKMGKLE